MLGKPSNENLRALAAYGASLGVNKGDLDTAIDFIQSGRAIDLSWSGKYCSGKDSIAEAVDESLGLSADHLSFARQLKAETQRMIEITRAASSALEAIDIISKEMNIPFFHAEHMVGLILSEPETTSTYTRTPMTRSLNQYHGTPVRRISQDERYWVNWWSLDAFQALAKPVSFFSTDTRFQNEAEVSQEMLCAVLRLDITEETQVNRIYRRDGAFDEEKYLETKDHSSETDLDGYEGFDLRYNNDDPTLSTSLFKLAELPYYKKVGGHWVDVTQDLKVDLGGVATDFNNWAIETDPFQLDPLLARTALGEIYAKNFQKTLSELTEFIGNAYAL